MRSQSRINMLSVKQMSYLSSLLFIIVKLLAYNHYVFMLYGHIPVAR